MTDHTATSLPGAGLDMAKMPGHWLLARLGKRVLRPGGLELTRQMLDALDIGPDDIVVELAPGLGTTARMTLAKSPGAYIGVERDENAARAVRSILSGANQRCELGTAAETGLQDGSANVVYGEAMLTMQTAAQKTAIVREAFRVLAPGGRYGIHELGLAPDDLTEDRKREVNEDLSKAIRVGARPLTMAEWRAALEAEGFEIVSGAVAPMHLLEPARLVQDEGLSGALRIVLNTLRDPAARRRVLSMRRAFRKWAHVLSAVTLIARKPYRSPKA